MSSGKNTETKGHREEKSQHTDVSDGLYARSDV